MGLDHHNDSAPIQPVAAGLHLFVVISHHEALVYKAELHGSVPQQVIPYNPEGLGRHDDSRGPRKPEGNSFYEAVAKTLQGAEKILLFGSGTGTSSAMEQLVVELKHFHADIAKRIVGTIVIDESHLSEDVLLAKAREFYADLEAKTGSH